VHHPLRPRRSPARRRWPAAAATVAAALGAAAAAAQDLPAAPLQLSPQLQPPPGSGDAARALPIIVRARELRGRPDLETVAEGDAEFRRGNTVIRADLLSYDHANDLATARGNVRVSRDGSVYTGPELQLKVQRFEGFFANPSYHFSRTGAGGTAQRFEFLDEERSVATGATYTSCPSDGSGDPPWLLSTARVSLDFGANEGIAENAVLRFYGVPILAAPALSFPLTDERKSGWLPPSIKLDSKSGLQVSVPYYWNIAPNRDATITPIVTAKRGAGLEGEFRYLQPSGGGALGLTLWPDDRLAGSNRFLAAHEHDGALAGDTLLRWRYLRVSDDDYWKDFPHEIPSLTPRLLATDLQLSRPVFGDWTAYARTQRWQVLQDYEDLASRIVAPFAREPQVGLRTAQRIAGDVDIAFETEANRFVNPTRGADSVRPTGVRVHALGWASRAFALAGGTVTPRLAFNAAHYALDEALDGRDTRARTVPTFSVDAQWLLERSTQLFGRDVLQTLEPRLFYVHTPYRSQDPRINFDSAPKDFNFESIFSENAFSGVDRVSDSDRVTAGVTTRFIDPATGAESVRLAVVQRYLLREQRITPDISDDPVPQFVPLRQRFSDVLLLGSSTLVRRWTLDASLQYNPDSDRTVRSTLSARYSPGPYRTVNMSYRLARGLSEQYELGWQWPLVGETPDERARRPLAAASDCSGSWYTVGRVNYSGRDSRITDSIVGFEYDAGCWIGRVVSERLSTGRSDATTRLALQLELVGLSRLGSNPLRTLKDNIPGYRLLREDQATAPSSAFHD
jgi:LPS-assembly protein